MGIILLVLAGIAFIIASVTIGVLKIINKICNESYFLTDDDF